MANSTKASREALREKIAARKTTQKAASSKWARLRQVAAEEAKDVDSALVEVADALGTMADAMSNLREHLDLIEAPKTATLRVRVAAAHRYASTFKRLAEENPEVVADALGEVYHSLDDVAGAIENLAEHMGVELNLSPVETAFGEEAEEEVEGEVEKEAAADWFTTDRDEDAKPKAPVIAALKPGQEKDGDKTKTRCKSCGAFLVKGKCPVSAKDCGRNKKANGGIEFVTDRDEDGEPKTPRRFPE